MTHEPDDPEDLRAALLECRRELAAVREQQEATAERWAPLEQARRQLDLLATALDEHLTGIETAREKASAPAEPAAAPATRGLFGRRRGPDVPEPDPAGTGPDGPSGLGEAEAEQLAQIRSSPLFDGAWYLQQNPDVARTGLSPALHYLRHGAAELLDPGPHFDARAYVSAQRLMPPGTNPLLHHHLQHRPGSAGG